MTKIALAVPELVDDQSVTIGQAIRNSIMATAGWEVFFLLEFGVLGLVGGTLYFAGGLDPLADWCAQHLESKGRAAVGAHNRTHRNIDAGPIREPGRLHSERLSWKRSKKNLRYRRFLQSPSPKLTKTDAESAFNGAALPLVKS